MVRGPARTREVPVLALSLEEAAHAIGVSPETFDRYVRDGLRIVRCGRRKLVAVWELKTWLDQNAARVLESL